MDQWFFSASYARTATPYVVPVGRANTCSSTFAAPPINGRMLQVPSNSYHSPVGRLMRWWTRHSPTWKSKPGEPLRSATESARTIDVKASSAASNELRNAIMLTTVLPRSAAGQAPFTDRVLSHDDGRRGAFFAISGRWERRIAGR